MLNLDLYPVSHPQVAGRVVDGEALVILSEANLVNVFNPVGSRVWELADGTRSIHDIIDAVISEYDVDRARAQADIVNFIEQLVSDRVLELSQVKIPAVSE